jgi:hypothetical protein
MVIYLEIIDDGFIIIAYFSSKIGHPSHNAKGSLHFFVGWVERSRLLGFANAWILIDASAPLKPAP